MRTVIMICTAVATVGWNVACRADGLIYRLPEDGASVKYDLEFKSGKEGVDPVGTGSLKISSVGEETVDNEKCRWVEFTMSTKRKNVDRDQAATFKLLIPEKHLGKGKSPGEHIVRGWVKRGDREVREIKELRTEIVATFLAGPLKDFKELEPTDVESKLGKLPCAGHSGRVELGPGEAKTIVNFENRLNDKAPFGVVTSVFKFGGIRDGKPVEGGTILIKLVDVGTKAVSELPDNR